MRTQETEHRASPRTARDTMLLLYNAQYLSSIYINLSIIQSCYPHWIKVYVRMAPYSTSSMHRRFYPFLHPNHTAPYHTVPNCTIQNSTDMPPPTLHNDTRPTGIYPSFQPLPHASPVHNCTCMNRTTPYPKNYTNHVNYTYTRPAPSLPSFQIADVAVSGSAVSPDANHSADHSVQANRSGIIVGSLAGVLLLVSFVWVVVEKVIEEKRKKLRKRSKGFRVGVLNI